METFPITDKRVFETEIEKLLEPKTSNSSFEYTVLRKDIDSNNHVNNLNYINIALEALPFDVYEKETYSNIEIMYKKQCLLGETIKCLYSFEDGAHIVTMKSEDLSTLHAIVRVW